MKNRDLPVIRSSPQHASVSLSEPSDLSEVTTAEERVAGPDPVRAYVELTGEPLPRYTARCRFG
jgi:hypothetical protein